MVVKFFPFEKFHNKKDIGSTRIRVHNLIDRWPDASLYSYGERADVMVFQKIYCAPDYKVPATFDAIRILDICDPDWMDNVYLHETLNGVHGVACPTEELANFLKQFTDKPVKVIRDRFKVEEFPIPKVHIKKATKVVWFGYAHNADLLKSAIKLIAEHDLELIVIADNDPFLDKWAERGGIDLKYTYVKFSQDRLYKELQKADFAVLPEGNRPRDPFKSENKTIIAQLCGLPVAKDKESLEKFTYASNRKAEIDSLYMDIHKEYNVDNSVKEYKELIQEIKQSNGY